MRSGQTSPADPLWQDNRSVGVLGMGIALPGEAVGTGELLKRIRRRFGIDIERQGAALAERLGIRSRHICRDFVSALESPRTRDTNAELAARALRGALDQAGLAPNDLDYLIGHTATPGSLLPPNVAQVAELVGYRGPYAEFRQACTGFANALVMAFGLLHKAPCGPIAIVGSETGSVFFDPRRITQDSGQLVNLVQMGDGAGACVLAPLSSVSTASHISNLFHGNLGLDRAPAFSLRAGGSDRIPVADAVVEFEHDYRSASEHGAELFVAAFGAARRAGIDPRTINVFLPHQVNGRIAGHLAAHLDVPEPQIFVNADRVGNTGSAAIWLALADLRGQLRGGDSVCVLGAEATKYMFGGFMYVHG
jgi:3-oxoacyl-[acyl-carrier-protein] synthase III